MSNSWVFFSANDNAWMGLAKALLTPEERYRTRALGYKYKLYGYGFPMAMVVIALLFEIESKNVRM